VNLPASGGRLDVHARARAAQPVIGSVELVVNGRVVAAEQAHRPTDELALTSSVEVAAGAWIAARSLSPYEIRSAFRTSMAAHTSPVYVEVVDHPLFEADDAAAVLQVIDGTVRWLERIAAIETPAERGRMARQIAESASVLRGRLNEGTGGMAT